MHPYATERRAADHLRELDQEAARNGLAALAREAATPVAASRPGAIRWRALQAAAGVIERFGADLKAQAQGHLERSR